MESLRSFVSFSGGELSAANDRTQDDGAGNLFEVGLSIAYCIQLFQLTLSVQSMKLKDKTESLRGIFMNKFINISHAWRKQ